MATIGGRRSDVIFASTAVTASGATNTVTLGDDYRRATFLLDVTAAASAVDDTLDVYLQRTVYKPDGSTLVLDDFVHFTQVLGNGSTKQYIARWSGLVAVEAEMQAPRSGSLAAGAVDQGGTLGPAINVKYVIVNGAGTHAFTFSITADFAD